MGEDVKASQEKEVSKIFEKHEPYIVSLTEPYQHEHTLEGIECKMPAGGLTNALDPLLKKYGGTWIASGTGDADWHYVDEDNRVEVPVENPQYTLRRIRFSKSEYQEFYYGFNHQTFWPLLHEVFNRPNFKHNFWKGYNRGNKHFAETVLEEIDEGEKPFVWFQDFQLSLAPKMLREKTKDKPDLKIMHFWHVPWPSPDHFFRCPWSEEILKGLLANDIIGFHTEKYAKNFLKTVQELPEVEIDLENFTIMQGGKETYIHYSPISIDYESINNSVKGKEVEQKIKQLKDLPYLSDKIIGLGVDRLDYAKGIPERLEAIDRFFEKYPEYIEKFVFIQAGAPLLERIPDYRKLSQKVEVMVDEINMKYEEEEWEPVLFLEEKLDQATLRALQRTADIYIVSSLHDGMNLVAKENTAADIEKNGVLLLSKFTGAAEELKDSIIINPYNQEGFADKIKKAIKMPAEEREKRMKNMRKIVKTHTIQDWLSEILRKATKNLNI